jgi:hypothetical protein
MKYLVFLVVAFVLMAPPAFGGKIVVNNDEWTMASGQPNAGAFAANLANWFSPGGPGSFLVYTGNFGLNNATFTGALTGAGHTVSVNTGVTFDLPTLSGYNGVFMGGYLGGYDPTILTNYVNAGGNVYLMAGTGTTGGNEGTDWDAFLNNFGFEYGPSYNGIGVTQSITSLHPIFAGIGTLRFDNGNTVLLYGSNPNASILESYNGAGLIGVYESAGTKDGGEVPEPATLGLGAISLLAIAVLSRRIRT